MKLQEQLEQERRDHELALRLAAENNSSVDDIQVEHFVPVVKEKIAQVKLIAQIGPLNTQAKLGLR